jgi:hypothetical protein
MRQTWSCKTNKPWRSITVSRQLQFTSWKAELSARFPDFSASVVAVLALYSFGMVLAGVAGLASVALCLAKHLLLEEDALRKRLREFYLDAQDKSGFKAGQKRRDFDPALAFAPLLRWLLSLWQGQHLPLAIDVTNLGERFHVLTVSVVVRGLAIPVAWKVLLGGVKEPWNPHWQTLLAGLKQAVPDDWLVVVLSDRGLESPWLFGAIVALGWHPLMRIKKGGKFRPVGWGQFYPLTQLAGRVGASFSAVGLAYSVARLPGTLLTRWDEGYAEPWFILTDLPPESASATWYGLRTWIEQGFKIIKGGGLDWEKTRMQDPERVERVWLAMAVATLWLVAVGVEDEVKQEQQKHCREMERQTKESEQQAQKRQQAEQLRRERQEQAQQKRRERLQKREAARTAKKTATKKAKAARHAQAGAMAKQRVHRVSKRGREELQAAWGRGQAPLPRHLHPEPWPAAVHPASTLSEIDFLRQQT